MKINHSNLHTLWFTYPIVQLSCILRLCILIEHGLLWSVFMEKNQAMLGGATKIQVFRVDGFFIFWNVTWVSNFFVSVYPINICIYSDDVCSKLCMPNILSFQVSNRRTRRWLNDRLLMELVPRLNAEEIRGLFAPPPFGKISLGVMLFLNWSFILFQLMEHFRVDSLWKQTMRIVHQYS